MVQVDDHKMHIYCTGQNKNGSPTVILIAGAGGLWTSWDRVQPEIAKETKVCSYDRSGLGFSDNNRKNDYSSAFAANELKQLLVASNIQAPYVVVGHSWGGKIARIFAHDNKESSRGLVLVESSHENQDKVPLTSLDKVMNGVMNKLFIFCSNIGVQRIVLSINKEIMKDIAYDQSNYKAALAGFVTPMNTRTGFGEAMTIDNIGALERARDLGQLPLKVLTADQSISLMPEWADWQKDLTTLSSQGEQTIVANTSHFIQIDQPQVVIDSIRDYLVD
jgi:pimeloyl-ACP methyl ester carboxylesterase